MLQQIATAQLFTDSSCRQWTCKAKITSLGVAQQAGDATQRLHNNSFHKSSLIPTCVYRDTCW
jgi:hypothetical protein